MKHPCVCDACLCDDDTVVRYITWDATFSGASDPPCECAPLCDAEPPSRPACDDLLRDCAEPARRCRA